MPITDNTNNRMSLSQLKKLIYYFYDMELSIYFMKNCLRDLETKLDQIKRAISGGKPTRYVIEPERDEEDRNKLGHTINAMVTLGVILGSIVGVMKGCEEGTGSAGFDVIFSVPLEIFICGIPGALIGLLFGAVVGNSLQKKADKAFEVKRKKCIEEANKRYSKEIADYERETNKRKIEYHNLSNTKNALSRCLSESEKNLQRLYNLYEINEDYRSVVAMGYMNDLVKIEAASSLKGPNGLYALVRKDLRIDRIEGVLTNISYKIDRVIDQNNRLYGAICQTKQAETTLCNKINTEIKRNGSNTIVCNSVAEYISGRRKKIEHWRKYL